MCTFHHDEHHRNAFTITGDPNRLGTLGFLTPGGWPIEPATPSTGRRDTAPRPRALRVVQPPESQPPDRAPDQSDRVTDQPDGLPDVQTRRQGKRYRGPTGEVLHLSLVDFTPPRRP